MPLVSLVSGKQGTWRAPDHYLGHLSCLSSTTTRNYFKYILLIPKINNVHQAIYSSLASLTLFSTAVTVPLQYRPRTGKRHAPPRADANFRENGQDTSETLTPLTRPREFGDPRNLWADPARRLEQSN